MEHQQPPLRTIALIVAAGNSERFGGDVAKPYIKLAGKHLIRHAIDAFLLHPRIDGVRVVISRKHHMLYKKAVRDITLFPPVFGAARRQDSVRLGLQSIVHRNPEFVLIHDAARPLIDADTISRVLDALEAAPAVLPYIPLQDTIRERQASDAKNAVHQSRLLDRSQLIAAQTPQGFHFKKILKAHEDFCHLDVTDDIAVAQHAGLLVEYVAGNSQNIKLTTPEQLTQLKAMLQTKNDSEQATLHHDIRTGIGFDVHAFVDFPAGEPAQYKHIALCGVKIAYERKLKGHSDADVGLHALVDALLGALGEGDIGQHFPPDDPKWAGADSKRFLLHAFELLKQRGGEINNIDITIMGETPRISPHRELMRQQIANLLKLDVRRVNVKATTTEKLGFLGRSEGLAAQAIATIKLPLESL